MDIQTNFWQDLKTELFSQNNDELFYQASMREFKDRHRSGTDLFYPSLSLFQDMIYYYVVDETKKGDDCKEVVLRYVNASLEKKDYISIDGYDTRYALFQLYSILNICSYLENCQFDAVALGNACGCLSDMEQEIKGNIDYQDSFERLYYLQMCVLGMYFCGDVNKAKENFELFNKKKINGHTEDEAIFINSIKEIFNQQNYENIKLVIKQFQQKNNYAYTLWEDISLIFQLYISLHYYSKSKICGKHLLSEIFYIEYDPNKKNKYSLNEFEITSIEELDEFIKNNFPQDE